MAGIAQFPNHGIELAMIPGFRVLQFFQLFSFLFKVPGSYNTDDLTLGRLLVKFFQPVLVEIHFFCAGDDIHNRFPRFLLGGIESGGTVLKFCMDSWICIFEEMDREADG